MVTDTRNNLNELKTLIDGKVPQAGTGTFAVTPTWSGAHVWQAAGLTVKRGEGGDFLVLEHTVVEAGHTNAHKLAFRATNSGTRIIMRPIIDGVEVSAKQLMFDFTAEEWQHGAAGDRVLHEGILDPANLAPTTFKSGRVRKKVTLLTSATSISVTPDTQGEHYVLQLAHTATITFNLPTGADADLGEHYSITGIITIENVSGAGSVTLAATGADKVETNGTQDNNVGAVQTLAYTITRFNPGTERHIVNFSWVA